MDDILISYATSCFHYLHLSSAKYISQYVLDRSSDVSHSPAINYWI